jgi:hypothetical protein
MTTITPSPLPQGPSQRPITPTSSILREDCQGINWKAKYDTLKVEYDDLLEEYEALQTHVNRIVRKSGPFNESRNKLMAQFTNDEEIFEEKPIHTFR